MTGFGNVIQIVTGFPQTQSHFELQIRLCDMKGFCQICALGVSLLFLGDVTGFIAGRDDGCLLLEDVTGS